MISHRTLFIALLSLAIFTGVLIGLSSHEISKDDNGDKSDNATSITILVFSALSFIVGGLLMFQMSGGVETWIPRPEMLYSQETLKGPSSHIDHVTTSNHVVHTTLPTGEDYYTPPVSMPLFSQ